MRKTMDCPNPTCNGKYEDIVVVDSRPARCHVKRRRKCTSCGYRFTTIEMMPKGGVQTALNDYVLINKKQYEKLKKKMRGAIREMNEIGEWFNKDLDEDTE
jgi:transcriptional regulator NrdR family protein